jgi:Mg2+ and Co2+ transporter CorA
MVAVYEDGKKAGGKRSLSDASAASQDPGAVVWISLVEPSREELDSVARQFELQELAQEDTETRKGVILKFQGRGLTFMVSPARYLDDSGTVEIGELDVLLEEGLAITVLRGEGPNFHDVEQGLEEGSYLSRLGSGAILRGLLHRVLDDYISVVDGLGDDLAGLEDDVLGGPGTSRLAGARIEFGTRHAPGRRAKPRPLDKLEGIGVRGTATESVQCQPYSGERQTERPDAQNQRMGRHNRCAYRDSEHLRDELPLHAGARLELWVPLSVASHGSELRRALRGLQAYRVALRTGSYTTRLVWRGVQGEGPAPSAEEQRSVSSTFVTSRYRP